MANTSINFKTLFFLKKKKGLIGTAPVLRTPHVPALAVPPSTPNPRVIIWVVAEIYIFFTEISNEKKAALLARIFFFRILLNFGS